MHMSTYCGFIFVVATFGLAIPTKPLNGCGYEVRKFEDILSDYSDDIVYFRHAI